MVASTSRLSDIQSHWARPFIEGLAQKNVIRGFPDGTFQPDRTVSRAEFAAMLQAAFPRPTKRPYVPFVDVPNQFWAATAIRQAYERGFLSGYPGQQFRPHETIPRVQALAALSGGLALPTAQTTTLPDFYQDSGEIPDWARDAIAKATTASLVVNHPERQRLRPNQPASRAEVAAFIYQGLVYEGQAAAVASPAIVRWQPTVRVSHGREFRAVWITSVWNKDWPSQSGLSTAQQQSELAALLDQAQAMNFNAVILQIRPEGDALYQTGLAPWSHWITGTQGKAPNPFYDPLEFAIAQCRRRNLELHAWFNPYRARTTKSTVNVRPHLAVTHPEVVYPWGNQLWMDPGAKVVQDHIYNTILDVVRRYDVDGIHLDDYFYPYPIAGQTFPDSKTYQAYRAAGGKLALADWRRENVNQLIQRLSTGIRSTKSTVKFGISPFGIYRPGQPPSVRGLDAYEQLYADSLKWLQQGWVDYLAPQLYWRTDAPAQSYPDLLQWWIDNNPKQRHVYAGNNLAQLDGRSWQLSEIELQVELTRQQNAKLALGNIFFSMDAFTTNRQGVRDRFSTVTYRTPALVPAMPWLSASPPVIPGQVQASSGKITWGPATAEIRAWTLYRQQNQQWILQQILPTTATSATLPPGTYALCAVNRLAQESAGVVVAV
jgi:uncharacterized lipoprotein YddW (UPF0748 family)